MSHRLIALDVQRVDPSFRPDLKFPISKGRRHLGQIRFVLQKTLVSADGTARTHCTVLVDGKHGTQRGAEQVCVLSVPCGDQRSSE